MAEEKPKTELTTWQEIATYLGVTDRTAQTWAKQRRLPVSRIGGRVTATIADLDRWKEDQRKSASLAQCADLASPPPNGIPIPEVAPPERAVQPLAWWQRPIAWLIGFIAFVITCGAILFMIGSSKPRQPSRFVIDGHLLTVYDERNQKLWDYVFAENVAPERITGPQRTNFFRHQISDIDGDGRKEVLIAEIKTLYCFASDGRLRWTHRMGREVSSRRGPVPADYYVSLVDTLSTPNRGGGRIVLGGYRGPGALFLVELLTKDGKTVGEYFHFGWFFAIAIGSLDGHEDVFLAGVDNLSGSISDYSATLVVLDPERFDGQASTMINDQRSLVNVAAAHEKAVLLIKEFAPNPDPNDYCRGQNILLGQAYPLELKVGQGAGDQPFAYFRFDRRMKLLNVLPEIRLLSTLRDTILKNVPPEKWPEAQTRALGDIRYVVNEFDR